MNPRTLKSVYNKINKQELKTEKVELASVQEIGKLANEYYSNTDTVNSIIKGLLSEARRADSKLDQAIKSANKMESIVTEVQKQAQELGINPNNIKELQSAKLAIQEAREYKQVQSIIKKFITTI
jgi:hypothetical protein